MPEIRTVTVYSYDELSPEAQERARDWWRDGGLDYQWWYFIYYDFLQIAERFGIDIDVRQKEPAIYFRGFCSQGDGASFFGTFRLNRGIAGRIREYAPNDTELERIAASLDAIQLPRGYQMATNIYSLDSLYCHEYTMGFDHEIVHIASGAYLYDKNPELFDNACETVTDAMRDLARWLYRALETEYYYLMSDDAVTESIRINDYRFHADGSLA